MDLVFVNGVVWRPGEQPATAVACSGERIAAIGSDAEIRVHINKDARVIDARGGTIMPAFNDAHVHFLMGSRSLDELDLFGVTNQAEIEKRISDHVRERAGGWVVGRGWFYSAFPGGMPTVELLDRLVPDRPAYLESFDAHTGWANSQALRIAGVTQREVLKEAAMYAVTKHIPKRTAEEDLAALRAGMKMAASRGVASVQEAGGGWDQLSLWESLRDAGDLRLRVRLAFDMTPNVDETEWRQRLETYEEVARARARDPWVKCGIVKAFADGVVESQTASVLDPYEGDGDDRGAPLWTGDQLERHTRMASERGWQVQVHAIGDAAIRQSLDAFEGAERDRRHRIEHIECPDPADIGRFAELGVVASMQPQHAAPALTEIWHRNLGPGRASRGWPWKKILASGGRLAFGTDWPVVPLDPFASLFEATATLSLEEAVAGWTSGAAYAEHSESVKGALREGMFADIVVLDRDLGRTPRDEFPQVKVEATAVGGRLVYEA
ncbi:MAG TPA: amidohydrolase [Candidatus Dormibacteraeota bacterium]|nr:amidohydrolase [Candidatus Dormibacteraeota bacterium]